MRFGEGVKNNGAGRRELDLRQELESVMTWRVFSR